MTPLPLRVEWATPREGPRSGVVVGYVQEYMNGALRPHAVVLDDGKLVAVYLPLLKVVL